MAAIHPTLFFTFFFTSLFPTSTTTTTSIYAVTPTGVLQGTQDTSPDGLPYYAFRGIPYAKPPVGERRWKLPEAAAPFQTMYQATEFKAGCPQAAGAGAGAGVVRGEDCLYLDVYVPHTAAHNYTTALTTNGSLAWHRWREGQDSNHTLPTSSPPEDAESGLAVMVWIHGGSYSGGDSRENAAWKMATEQGVVVVVIQYRLGALGFLSSGSSELLGNYGLWDQRLALKWVKANIRGFGGAAAMMTVAGESAGSTSVSQHTLSPQSAGLFRRAVLLSGTADATWCFNYRPRNTFDRFSKDAGCGDTTSSVTDRLRCLMSLPADVIYKTSVVTEAGNFVTFVPTVDGVFFPDTPAKLLQDQNYLTSVGFYNYDFLVGALNNEGVIIFPGIASVAPSAVATGRLPYAMADKAYLKATLTSLLGPRYDPSIQDVVSNRYFYPRDPAQATVSFSKVFDVYTDLNFIVPAVKMVRRHVTTRRASSGATSTSTSTSSAGSASSAGSSASSGGGSSASPGKSYLFFFDWVPSMTEGSMFAGMPHALDVDYLWGLNNDSLLLYSSLRLPGPILPREHLVSRMYGDMIGAFVRTGNPNNGIDANLKGQWLPYDVSNETFLRFSLNSSIDHHLQGSRVSFWVDLIPVLQSRWLNQTANQQPGNQCPTNQGGGSSRLGYLDLDSEDTNAVLISMIVVAGVMVLLSVFLSVTLIRFYRRKRSNLEGLETLES